MKPSRLAARFLALLMVALMAAAFSLDAQAKRMGGGKSIGRQSSQVTQRQATPPAAPAAPAAASAKPGQAASAAGKPWAGMLGGLAAGLGLAWLAHALGFGAGFGNVLLIGLLVLAAIAIWRAMQRARQGGTATSRAFAFQGIGAARQGGMPAGPSTDLGGTGTTARPWESRGTRFNATAAPASGSPLQGAQTWGIPEGFDVAGFTEAAKRNFTSVQAAWDKGDLQTLRTVMTDEMLAEMRSQLAERERTSVSGQVHQTDVVTLDAQLLGIEELDDVFMTSVEFSGRIREDGAADPAPFREVWNMTRARNGSGGWKLAGVQALE